MVKYEAKKTLINKDYKGYMLMINEYIKEGGAFDAEMIMDFASALISLNKKKYILIYFFLLIYSYLLYY